MKNKIYRFVGNNKIMAKTRFSIPKNFQGLIIGKDNAKVFEEGFIYQAEEICGIIMIKKIGAHAELPEECTSLLDLSKQSPKPLLTQQEFNMLTIPQTA